MQISTYRTQFFSMSHSVAFLFFKCKFILRLLKIHVGEGLKR